jgi:preprotein translocase subunit SecE
MAKKSKTQRAKASARRQEKKAAALEEIENPSTDVEETEEQPKKSLFSKSESKSETAKPAKKAEPKPKKKRFKFLREVRSEMKRVTWPTRQDVLQWSGVVVAALIFFGVYVYILDSGIITPLLVAFSGLAG